MLLISLFLLAEWAGADVATAVVGERIIRYRYVALTLVLLLGIGHLISLFRCTVLPLMRMTQSEAHVRMLLESIPDAFILMHRDGTYLDAHAAQDSGLPRPASEMVGKNVRDILPPELAQRALENVRRALETNEPQTLEYARTFGDKTFHFEIHNRRYSADSVVAILRDITKRRAAEERVRHQAVLLENLLDAVVSVGTDFRIASWNRAAEEIYGWTAEEVIGKLLSEVIPADWSPAAEQAALTQLRENGFWRGQVVHSHRDGHPLNIFAASRMVYDEAGAVMGAVSVNRNVTELKQAESALQESETRNSALIQIIPDSLGRVNNEGVYLDAKVSQELAQQRGEGEMAGRHLSDTLPPVVAERALSLVRQVIEDGQARKIEYELKAEDEPLFMEARLVKSGPREAFMISRDVTEHRRAEEQVRYQAALVENMLDAVISVNTDFCILSWNPAAEKIYGWSADEAIGGLIDDVIPCHWSEEEEATSKKALMEEGFWRGEVVQSHQDGRLLNVVGSTSLFRNAEGEVTGAVSINRDVTELRRAESALRESESRNSALIEVIPDSLARVNRDGIFLDINIPQDLKWPLGAEEIAGKSLFDLAPVEQAERGLIAIRQVIESGELRRVEYELPTSTGTLYIETRLIRSADNEAVMISRDITERRQQEEQLRYQAKLLTSMSDAVFSVDTEDHILVWNKAAETIYGWRKDEALGKVFMEIMAPELVGSTQAEFDRALEEEGAWRGEVIKRHRDGTQRHVLSACDVLYDANGQRTGVLTVSRDVTEQKRAEQALRKSEALNQALINVIPDSLARVNAEGRYLYVKIPPDMPSFMSEEEMVGKHMRDVMPPETVDGALETVRRVIESGQAEEVEYPIEIEGQQCFIEARLVQSGPNEALIISRDVTERHRTEEQLRYQAQLLASMSDVVFSVDNESRILSWNRAAEALYGWRKEEVRGKIFTDVTFPEIVGGTMEEFAQAMAAEGTWSGEVTKRHRDGSKIDTLSSCDIIHDTNGQPTGMLVVSRDITEQKQAERALRESEARQRAILAAIPDSFGIISRDGVYLSMKLQQNVNLGVSAEQLIGRRVGELVKPEITEEALRIIDQVLEHDVVYDEEFRLPNREEEVYIEARMVKSGADEVLAIARNVTERRRAEEQLRFQAELLQNVSDAVVSTDMEMRIVSWNHAAEEMYGWCEAEVVGQRFGELLKLEYPSGSREQAVAKLMQDNAWQGEQVQHCRDGKKLTILSSISLMCDHEGNPTGFLGVNRDISERKEAEIALQESEARFRAMVQSAAEAIVLYDMDEHRVVEANDNVLKLFKLSSEELRKIGGTALSAEIQPSGGNRKAEIANIRRKLEEQGHLTYEWLYHVEGQDLLAEVRAVTLPDRNRWLVRHSIVDITERRQREERLQQSQKLESLGLLAGGIAHDFNNLLTGILGQTSLAQHRLTVEHPARTNMERATAAGLRARTLIQQMLAYAGRGQANVQRVNLNDIIQESVQLFETSLPTTIFVETQLDEALPAANADAGQMQQLIVNLVLNAADAITNAHASMETNGERAANSSEESGRILLKTTVRQIDEPETNLYLSEEPLAPGRYIMLRIRDNGHGMSPTTLMRVFDPFFSTKPEGTGLGLSVAMGIIKRHRGGLNVSSQLNRGSTFEILLPIAEEASPGPQPLPATQASATGTVLVIDDEATLRQTVRDILESVKMTVLTAPSGRAGVDVLRERAGEIDLVLLDMRMPGLDGTQTLELLREIDPALKVIISSGYSSSEQIARLDGARDVEFLPKPYVADELISTVRRALGKANSPPLGSDANNS